MSREDAEAALSAHGLFVAGWQVDAAANRISRDGQAVKLEPRAMAVLVYLTTHPGRAVTREELEREVWRDAVVGYDALSISIAKLRKAFGDDRKAPTIIETLPKVGYRLIAEVGRRPSAIAGQLPEDLADGLQRKLAAIMYADIAGYSRLTGQDEDGTHRMLSAHLDLVTGAIERYGGRVVHFAGDAVLADFSVVSEAVTCAVAVQHDLVKRNADVSAERKLQFRIGVNLGEVIVDRNDIYGDGVNIAARLEGLAEPGGVCLSGTVVDAVGHRLPLEYRFLGEQTVKNIIKPVRAYHAELQSGVAPPAPRSNRPPTVRSRVRLRLPVLMAGLAVLVLMLGGYWVFERSGDVPRNETRTESNSEPSSKPSVVVLPFENLSDNPGHAFFADGMTDDLTTDLSKMSGLFVVARHSVSAVRDDGLSLRELAEALGARYVLEGSVRRAGGRLRINAQLLDTTTGGSLWAERYDGTEDDVFALQDKVVGNIIAALGVRLTATERSRIQRRPTGNLEAYDAYLRAERRANHAKVGLRTRKTEAIALYRKAIALDPEFTDAHAGLARMALSVWEYDNTDVMPGPAAKKLAYEAAGKLLSLDPDHPGAYAVLARLQSADGQHALALETARKGVSVAPNNAATQIDLAFVSRRAGEHDLALKAVETAFRLDPRPSAEFHGEMGLVLFFLGRAEQAVPHLEKTLKGLPYLEELAMAYAETGRVGEAAEMIEHLFKRTPFANLGFYRALNKGLARADDLEHLIRSLERAGVPKWPFGFRPPAGGRLDETAIVALTKGRAWNGHDWAGAAFFQQFTEDGRVALRSRSTMLAGTARIDGDQLCLEYPGALLGRADCGHVYRNPAGRPDDHNEYVHVSLGEIYHFSVQ